MSDFQAERAGGNAEGCSGLNKCKLYARLQCLLRRLNTRKLLLSLSQLPDDPFSVHALRMGRKESLWVPSQESGMCRDRAG
jgi:hypothetical protein